MPITFDNILAILQPQPRNLAHPAGVVGTGEKGGPGEETDRVLKGVK